MSHFDSCGNGIAAGSILFSDSRGSRRGEQVDLEELDLMVLPQNGGLLLRSFLGAEASQYL